MRTFFSRVPAAAVFTEIDGNAYARIPHRLDANENKIRIIEDFDSPRMVRFNTPSFIKNGEAYVYFARVDDALSIGYVPFGVSEVQS